VWIFLHAVRAIIAPRHLSALYSTLLIQLIFKIGKKESKCSNRGDQQAMYNTHFISLRNQYRRIHGVEE
jgi:hypothetical protein